MDTKRTERGHETIRQILQVLFYLAVFAGVVLLSTSCINSAKEHSDAQDAEVFEEGYNEGWYAGQRELIEHIKDEIIGEAPDSRETASDLLNGMISKEEFVKDYDGFLDILENLEPRDR